MTALTKAVGRPRDDSWSLEGAFYRSVNDEWGDDDDSPPVDPDFDWRCNVDWDAD